MTGVAVPFARWLGRYPDAPIRDRQNGADRVALLIDDRDDETTRRVFGNALAVLGDGWNHRYIRARGDNAYLTRPDLWASIPEAWVLLYQRDTVIFRKPAKDEFAWDMVGAPCGAVDTPYWTLNGGLSLRRRQAMRDVLALGEALPEVPEDVYYTAMLRAMGRPLPDRLAAGRFAVESAPDYTALPVGIHGTDKQHLPPDVAESIVADALAAERGGGA